MIHDYANNLAAQMGIQLSKVSVIEGQSVGCLDVYLLHMSTKDHLVSALVHRTDFENLHCGNNSDRLELKLRVALSRLQVMLESKY